MKIPAGCNHFVIPPVIFMCILLIYFAVMTWLVVYPGPFFSRVFQLYNFTDVNFKMLLVAVAALNFLICFVVEVSDDIQPCRALYGLQRM